MTWRALTSNGTARSTPFKPYTRWPVGRYRPSRPPSISTVRSPVVTDSATMAAWSQDPPARTVKQHPLVAGKHLRPVEEFAVGGRNQQLRRATRTRHSAECKGSNPLGPEVTTSPGARTCRCTPSGTSIGLRCASTPGPARHWVIGRRRLHWRKLLHRPVESAALGESNQSKCRRTP